MGEEAALRPERDQQMGRGHHWLVLLATPLPAKIRGDHLRNCKAIMATLSADLGIDLEPYVCSHGNIQYVFASKPARGGIMDGLTLVSAATTQLATVLPLPTASASPPAGVRPEEERIEDDFNHRSDWHFLEQCRWKRDGDHFTRPNKASGISASVEKKSKDGVPLLRVFTSNGAPLEPRSYNAFDAYALLKHNGDSGAARADLAKQGYGRKRIPLMSCTNWMPVITMPNS